MARVSASSSKICPAASVPRMRTATCISTRWLRRRAPVVVEVFETWAIQPLALSTIHGEVMASRGCRLRGFQEDTGEQKTAFVMRHAKCAMRIGRDGGVGFPWLPVEWLVRVELRC